MLVVDDDPDIREALRDTLTTEGYAIAEAADGQAALDYLHAHPAPGMILLDWNMAPMNGGQLMIELAKEPGLAVIPTVLLTADPRAPTRAEGNAPVECLRKPIRLDDLVAVVQRYCGAK